MNTMNTKSFSSAILALVFAASAFALAGCSLDAKEPTEETATTDSAFTKSGGSGPRLGYTCAGLHCTCSGDVDCNDMFSDGVCGDIAQCDVTNPTPTCECLSLRAGPKKPPRIAPDRVEARALTSLLLTSADSP